MDKIIIEECKHGVSKGGVACGPVEGSVNAAVKFIMDGETKWITNSEYVGIPNFYITDDSVFERLVNDDLDDEFAEYMKKSYVDEYKGICLAGEYEDIYESIEANKDNPVAQLIEYVIELTRAEDNKE